jgi:hypothetical protein
MKNNNREFKMKNEFDRRIKMKNEIDRRIKRIEYMVQICSVSSHSARSMLQLEQEDLVKYLAPVQNDGDFDRQNRLYHNLPDLFYTNGLPEVIIISGSKKGKMKLWILCASREHYLTSICTGESASSKSSDTDEPSETSSEEEIKSPGTVESLTEQHRVRDNPNIPFIYDVVEGECGMERYKTTSSQPMFE